MNAILLSLCLTAEAAAQPPRLPPPPPVPMDLILPAPLPPSNTLPPPPTSVPVKVPTFEEFMAGFVPLPGIHDVTVVHPVTNKPVNLVFRLPDLPLKKTYKGKTRVTFDYGKTEVTLIFRLIGGKADVRYD
jgi:hypothetical protein